MNWWWLLIIQNIIIICLIISVPLKLCFLELLCRSTSVIFWDFYGIQLISFSKNCEHGDIRVKLGLGCVSSFLGLSSYLLCSSLLFSFWPHQGIHAIISFRSKFGSMDEYVILDHGLHSSGWYKKLKKDVMDILQRAICWWKNLCAVKSRVYIKLECKCCLACFYLYNSSEKTLSAEWFLVIFALNI